MSHNYKQLTIDFMCALGAIISILALALAGNELVAIHKAKAAGKTTQGLTEQSQEVDICVMKLSLSAKPGTNETRTAIRILCEMLVIEKEMQKQG